MDRGERPGAADPKSLSVDEHAAIAAQLAVKADRPRAEVLAPFGLSEAAWDAESAAFHQRLVAEIRERAGTGAPIEERYPLSTSYAKAHALAMREAREQAAREAARDDEATVRIPPGAAEEPLSLLGASNRAARS